MPKLSDTMSVGTLVKWHKQVGDKVSNGDTLAEVETDKATMELENFDDGVLLQTFVEEGAEVPIGSPLAAVGDEGETVEAPAAPVQPKDDQEENQTEKVTNTEDTGEKQIVEETLAEKDLPVETAPEVQVEEKIAEGRGDSDVRILASPLAKKIAKEEKIDLSQVKGSGPAGRITKKDLLSQKSSLDKPLKSTPKTTPLVNTGASSGLLVDQSLPVSKMRSIIARRLLESKSTIPHFYLQKEINSLPLKLAREAMNKKLAQRSAQGENPLKITLNDLILLACAETIKWIPEINSSWEKEQIRFHGKVHLAFGVAVDDGLVTPVIRDAGSLDLTTLSLEAKSLIGKARTKKLLPDEMDGSTFTVTNLGMFGIDFFSGIINPPNAAILSVGASVKKPVLDSSGNLQAGETMTLGLSCDHRLVDGAIGASFLKKLGETLEEPASLLV